MAVDVLAIIKVVGPIVASIANTAIPAFTAKKSESAQSDPILSQQIKELQDASTQNAKEMHVLAEHLKNLIDSTEQAAAVAAKQVALYKSLVFVSLGVSIFSSVLAVFALVR